MNERQEHRADGNKKSLFAAIIGGLLAGVVILTVSAFLIYKRFCRNNTTRSVYFLFLMKQLVDYVIFLNKKTDERLFYFVKKGAGNTFRKPSV